MSGKLKRGLILLIVIPSDKSGEIFIFPKPFARLKRFSNKMIIANVAANGNQKNKFSNVPPGFSTGRAASSLKTEKGNENVSPKTLYLYGCKSPQPIIKKKKKLASEKLADKRNSQATLVKLSKSIHEIELADKFSRCSQNFSFLTCGDKHVLDIRADFRCEQYKLCPFCAQRRANRLCNKYLPLATIFVRRSMEFTGKKVTPCHLVLTQSQEIGETAVQARQRLYDSIIKLVRRKFIKENFVGGIGSFEYTISKTVDKNGLWHFHCHLTVFRIGFWGKETGKLDELKRLWAECSPNAENLYLGVIDDVNRGLSETIKYGMKPADIKNLDGEKFKQLLKLKGKKMTFTFGDFKKFCAEYKLMESEKLEFAREKEDFIIRDADGEFLGYKPCLCGKPLFQTKLSTPNLIEFVQNMESISKARGKPH
jgi:hypothetical protein